MKNQLKIGFIVAALGVAGYLLYNHFTSGGPPRKTTYWICNAAACKHEFNMPFEASRAQILAQYTVSCPKCGGKETTEGFLCEACQRVVPPRGHGSPPEKCTFCKQPLAVRG